MPVVWEQQLIAQAAVRPSQVSMAPKILGQLLVAQSLIRIAVVQPSQITLALEITGQRLIAQSLTRIAAHESKMR